MDQMEQVSGGWEIGIVRTVKLTWGWVNGDPEANAILDTVAEYMDSPFSGLRSGLYRYIFPVGNRSVFSLIQRTCCSILRETLTDQRFPEGNRIAGFGEISGRDRTVCEAAKSRKGKGRRL